jgi:predicted MFS family arabinose efflux permease
VSTVKSESAGRPPGDFSGYQKFVVAVLAFLQFSIILDFMLLAPLGVLVIPALRITTSQFGLVVSTYAFSAGASALLTAGFADRFDRKKLLLFFYSGFIVGTALCGLASSFHGLLFARMVTGLFAGVVGAASFAIVTDLFPLEMRGRALGVIQSSFAASSVLGVPLALVLSNRWGWNMPFFMVVAVCLLVDVLIWVWMRPIAAHLGLHPDRNPLHHLLTTVSNRRYLLGFATTALLTVGGFMLMPFMTVFTVHNIGVPVDQLPLLYLITGIFSFVAGPLIGRASDAFGSLRVFAFGCVVTVVMVMIYTHLHAISMWLLIVIMVLLQIGIFSRIISSSALTSALPGPADRGAYMSISSSLQQISGGVASVIGGLIVVQAADGTLLHFDVLGYLLVCSTLACLFLMYFIDRLVGRARPAAKIVQQAAAASE